MRHTAEESLARMRKNWPKAFTPTAEVLFRIYRVNDLARAMAQKQASTKEKAAAERRRSRQAPARLLSAGPAGA